MCITTSVAASFSSLVQQKWQLGTAFLPDSVGYLVGTSCTAGPAYRFGRWRVAILAMLLLAIATAMVSHLTRFPFILITNYSTSMVELVTHLCRDYCEWLS